MCFTARVLQWANLSWNLANGLYTYDYFGIQD
jgi:hypothetical protein